MAAGLATEGTETEYPQISRVTRITGQYLEVRWELEGFEALRCYITSVADCSRAGVG